MKITVLGCGAIGQLWLTALYRQNHQLQGWLRVEQPYCHVNLQAISGEIENHTFIANDPAFLQDSALLLVTLKAWQVSDALRALAPVIPETCPILLLHNGIGSAEELSFLTNPLLLGFTTQAAKRNGNLIEHVAYGTTHIGPSNPQASHLSHLADILHQALPDVAWHDNIAPASWHKLAVNCVINPLSVIYNCTNGELLVYPEHIDALCHEIAQVMNRKGYNASTEELSRYVQQVMAATGPNTSSMLQDIREQRHTEIDYITGYLVRQAHQYGIAVPANTLLYEQIKWKENAYDRASTGLSSPWE